MKPTSPKPRTKPPEERRDELMRAAQRLFLKKGVGPTTIEEITTGAGVAKGTFYLYFHSKEDVLAALGDRFAQELLAKIRTAMAAEASAGWKAKLAAWTRATISGYLDSIQLHDILFYGSRPATREGLVDNVVIDELAQLLQAGNAAGAWSIEEPRSTAVFLFSGVHAVVDDAYTKEKRLNQSRLAKTLEHLTLQCAGLGSTGSS